MLGKKKKEEDRKTEKNTLLWPGFIPTNFVSKAERSVQLATVLCPDLIINKYNMNVH